MKFSTYTLLISASAAIKMQSMPPMEETEEAPELKCEWKDDACKGLEVPMGETDMCLILMTEEDCTKGPQAEEALPEEDVAGATQETEEEGEMKPEDKVDDKEMETGSEDEMTEEDVPEDDTKKPEDIEAGAEDETKPEDEVVEDDKLEEEKTGKEEEMPEEETKEEKEV